MTSQDTDEPLTGSCVVRPELTEGPYYVNENLNRSDIRADTGTGAVKEGALLALTFDGIYGQSSGQTLVAVTATDQGYAATFDIALFVD